MNIRQILDTTKHFYQSISENFSNTRQYAWKGWKEIFTHINLNNIDNILDLGCGNGRFYEFLTNRLNKQLRYKGLDGDKGLLDIAQSKYPNATFKNIDIFEDIDKIKEKHDLVVGFGITHHIPNKEFRLDWFKKVSNLVNKDGYLIFSFWNFLDKKSLIKAENLEKNDYWLGWGNENIKRYCHYYDEEELEEIDKVLENKGLVLEKEIKNVEDLNTYKIYRYN